MDYDVTCPGTAGDCSPREECGVFGIYSNNPDIDVAAATYYGLFALQHRGQQSCGIYVSDRGVPVGHKSLGLVNDVFTRDILDHLGEGQMAVGHVRYGTAGSNRSRNAQPLHVNHSNGSLVVAHNGALINAAELRRQYEMDGCIFHSTSDTEVIAYAITRERLKRSSIEEAVCAAIDSLKGAYSMVLMSSQKLIACRDPLGVRPLCIGVIDNAAGGASYVVASESCALDAVGAHFLQDVQPGEIIVIDQDGMRTLKSGPAPKKCMCVFEYIYFARPDSVIDGNSVNISRESAGKILAQTYRVNADVVIGVPDSGLDAAVGYARESGIPYAIGLIKNKYIGRTFIQPYQKDRATGVRIKLNPVPSVVKGKRVIMVDDSIVRGTTMARIVGLLREAGAVQVHVMSSAPEFKHLCYFGTDIDARENLIANQYDTYEEIAAAIGADSVGFLPVRELTKLVRPKQGICDACFTGEYPIEIPAEPCKIKIKYEEKLPG